MRVAIWVTERINAIDDAAYCIVYMKGTARRITTSATSRRGHERTNASQCLKEKTKIIKTCFYLIMPLRRSDAWTRTRDGQEEAIEGDRREAKGILIDAGPEHAEIRAG